MSSCPQSILTCILGAVLRQFFPEPMAYPAPKLPIISRGRRIPKAPAQGSKVRQTRSSSKRPPDPSAPGISKCNSEATTSKISTNGTSTSLSVPPDSPRLRRVSSLDSFSRRHEFVLVAPVITINHVDHVDNMNVKAPTITIHPSPNRQSEDKVCSKRRSLTLAHPPSLPDLPRRHPSPPREGSRSGSPFRLSSLKPLWGGEKPKIHRSASSPQLSEFTEGKLPLPDSKARKKDKTAFSLSGKSSKKTLRQEKSLDCVASQCKAQISFCHLSCTILIRTPASHSKFFSSSPKNVEKKRSQVLRTQPYEAPYFVRPPAPPMFLDDVDRSKEGKRSKTLPPEKLVRPSTAPHRFFKLDKT